MFRFILILIQNCHFKNFCLDDTRVRKRRYGNYIRCECQIDANIHCFGIASRKQAVGGGAYREWIKDIDISLRTLLHFKSSRSQETQRQFTLLNHQKVFLECTKFLVWHNIYKLGSVKIKRHRLIICTTFQLRDAPQNQSCNFDQDGGGIQSRVKKIVAN